jgi:hypothetical protein
VITAHDVAQQPDVYRLNFVLLAEPVALGFKSCLRAPQLLGLVPKLNDSRFLAIGLFRNLSSLPQQFIELGDELVVARGDLL